MEKKAITQSLILTAFFPCVSDVRYLLKGMYICIFVYCEMRERKNRSIQVSLLYGQRTSMTKKRTKMSSVNECGVLSFPSEIL
jgi:hypothetical protein